MANVAVDRVDHLGIVAGVIQELGIIKIIDNLIGIDPKEKVSTGEAIAAMIINGLGFSNRPLTLTPQFFTNCPVDLFFRPGVFAEDFNRFKLGRALDELHAYGCTSLFSQVAENVCKQEQISTQNIHLDTTSFSLTGEHLPDSDENEILITHGYSKDHRPDLKQAMLELIVSQDGGVPLLCKAWSGNSSDNVVFKERCQALVEALKGDSSDNILHADCKLYSSANTDFLKRTTFITRIPENIKAVQDLITKATSNVEAIWTQFDDDRQYQVFSVTHYDIDQRWIVIRSKTSIDKGVKQTGKCVSKEDEAIKKSLYHLQAKRFDCQQDARQALGHLANKWRYHSVANFEVIEHKHFEKKGRPSSTALATHLTFQITATVQKNIVAITHLEREKSCFVLASNASSDSLSTEAIIAGYAKQNVVEGGFRFLKDPMFFTSSLFIKKPSRIEGLLTVMTLALLVYSVAERRLRRALAAANETIPNQIKQPTNRPTLRWVFQLFYGVNRISCDEVHKTDVVWHGITALRRQILAHLGDNVMKIYGIQPLEVCSM
jgi:transposase